MSDIVPSGQGHLNDHLPAGRRRADRRSLGFLLVPRGAAHTFGNSGAEPARLFVLHAPAMDAYFEELHQLWSGGQAPSREAERELMNRYGMEPA